MSGLVSLYLGCFIPLLISCLILTKFTIKDFFIFSKCILKEQKGMYI